MEAKKTNPTWIFVVLCFLNLFNFIDRGIIPGSTIQFISFIQQDIDTAKPDVYLGLLQSSFVVGFVIGVLIFGHLIHYHARFYLTGIGTSIYVMALIWCGASHYFKSYASLAVARFFCGFGQAALQTAVPPWIEANAPPRKKTFWLAIFYVAVTVGTAIGFVYSSQMSVVIGWQFAFFIEAIFVAPFVVFLFYISPQYPCEIKLTAFTIINQNQVAASSSEIELPESRPSADFKDDATSVASSNDNRTPPTVWKELKSVMKNPVYLCITLGFSTLAASLNGLSLFGSAFMMGLGYFDTQSSASTVFGALVSLSGLIGTLTGGLIIDRMLKASDNVIMSEPLPTTNLEVGKDGLVSGFEDHSGEEKVNDIEIDSPKDVNTESKNEENEPLVVTHDHTSEKTMRHMNAIFKVIFTATLIGSSLLVLSYFIHSEALYILILFVGFTIIFVTYSGINLGIMSCVPHKHRSFALAMTIVIGRGIGDIPSPIVIGYIKDDLAPGCIAADHDGTDNVAASEECRAEDHGLRLTLLIAFGYLFIGTLFYGLGWYLNSKKLTKKKYENVSP